MHCETSPEKLADHDRGGRASAWLCGLAIAFIVGALLLISPAGESQRPGSDSGSGWWLLQIIRLQSLYYTFPTYKGIEIKVVLFQVGACLLSLIGCGVLLSRMRGGGDSATSPRWSYRSPLPWFVLVLLLSAVSAYFANAQRPAAGGTATRLMWLLWWWPLAILLTPKHTRRLAFGMVLASSATALLCLWYQAERGVPGIKLAYPMGNSLVVAACLLPALMVALVHAVADLIVVVDRKPPDESPAAIAARRRRILRGLGWAVLALIIAAAQAKTRSRSAYMGFTLGVLMAVYLASDRFIRAWILATLAVICGGAAGYFLISGDVGDTVTAIVNWLAGNSPSIRQRVEHEWPFAFAIFLKNPWLGAGEGGFGRLVGPYARAAQFDDPSLLSADGTKWEAFAHNEVLEMLTSIGLLGAAAMLAAVFFTLRAAHRAAEAETDRTHRLWLVALTAAFFAAGAEELFDIALHRPGFTPIALTTWACLWGLIRARYKPPLPSQSSTTVGLLDSLIMSKPARIAAIGFTITLSTVALGLACSNANSFRAFFEANRLLSIARPADAIAKADLAEQWQLDPETYLFSLFMSAQARVNEAKRLVESSDVTDHDRGVGCAQEVLQRVEHILAVADRFLRARELEACANTFLALAAKQRGDALSQEQYAEHTRRAWRLNRIDEPFQRNALIWLWDATPTARADERLSWLRDFMRGGEVDMVWDSMLHKLGTAALPPLRAWMDVGVFDLNTERRAWRDPLSPETFRLAARVGYLQGNLQAALVNIQNAVTLYARAGSKLARAHAAALHEQANYLFEADPNNRLREAVELLHQGYELINGPTPRGPLAGNMGRSRLPMLLLAGALEDAQAQAAILATGSQPREAVLADGYLDLVNRMANRATGKAADTVFEWAQRTAELDPTRAPAHRWVAELSLRLGKAEIAREALIRFRRTESRVALADAEIARLKAAYPLESVWGRASSAPASPAADPP